MLEGLNTAAAGMAAQQQRLDAVSNDLANANTTGYKHVRVGFRDLVYTQAGRASAQGSRLGSGSAMVDAGRGFAQGAVQQTEQPFDVAIQGDGFLRIKMPDGRQALTRDGALHVDGTGKLTTSSGAVVQPAITIPKGTDPSRIVIDTDGTVRAAGTALGRIAIVSVRSTQGLQAVGDNAFLATAQSGPAGRPPAGTILTQGALEASNTDVSEAMVTMLESQRAFQLTSKAIQTQDQMWEIANGVKR
jgi:flagellar basal-body rod protein FlgG